MRIAAIYDIHGNLPALEAVLNEIQTIGVDRIVVGGDVVPGPMPRQTLARLFHLNVPVDFIYGNGEVAVLQQMAGEKPVAVPQQFRPIIEWTAAQLDSQSEQKIRDWPKTLRLQLPSLGSVLFCHATPGDENTIFTRLTPAERLQSIFAGIAADVVVCGHTHMQFDRTIGNLRIVNAGSVGMPFGRPGAYWVLLGSNVQFRHTGYNLADAAERIRNTGYPQAEHFAVHNVLKPPAEELMLETFGRNEVGQAKSGT